MKYFALYFFLFCKSTQMVARSRVAYTSKHLLARFLVFLFFLFLLFLLIELRVGGALH